MSNLKTAKIYDNQITLEIFPFRNGRRDVQMVSIIEKVKQATGETYGAYLAFYAMRLAYTDNVETNFTDEILEEQPYLANVTDWWDKVVSSDDVVETFLYWFDNIPNVVGNEWLDKIESIQNIVVPSREKNTPQEEVEATDPN